MRADARMTAVRAFVALPCPPLLRAAIARKIGEWKVLHTDVAWADPAASHATLRFLGNAEPEALDRLTALLSESAGTADSVRARPGVTGAFPGWRRARVLWLALESGGAIERVAASVEAAARSAGFEADEHPFTAHLTLGRVRGRQGAPRAAAAVREWTPEGEAEPIPEMVLYRSDLGPQGARHTPLARFPIG
ncbi:MAG TPA: RNA 2',3'-cyclic phosphodiesterase [Gemmatimonadota bacterium]|nr:RNA 2',3'-cyclic phosphodiesterase [Gemmatimonadota bacterium]